MQIAITEWALQSYLELRQRAVFLEHDYRTALRPDVERLRDFPRDPRFSSPSFWGPASDRTGITLQGGFKMKWHNLGPGRVQLRLCVAIHAGSAFLCQAFVKSSESVDKREMAKLKDRIRKISLGRYSTRGTL